MAYPYKKMTSEDFDYIRSVTASDRVWVGDEIAKEYYRDEMPEYGVFPPELYVEVLNKEEISNVLGGRWITLPDGTRIYIEEDEEEGEEDEIIFV